MCVEKVGRSSKEQPSCLVLIGFFVVSLPLSNHHLTSGLSSYSYEVEDNNKQAAERRNEELAIGWSKFILKNNYISSS